MPHELSPKEIEIVDKEGAKALQHYLTSCTVTITSKTPRFEHGTGVVIKLQDQTYIVTAAHVLEAEPNDGNILIIGRPDSSLKEVHQSEFPSAFIAKARGQIKSSRGTCLPIIKRIVSKELKDIAALKVRDVEKHLPYTIFHDLSGQGAIDTSEGKAVIICGFPGAIAQHAPDGMTEQPEVAIFTYFAWQTISKSPRQLDPRVDFVTNFNDKDTCDPKGMSGGGAWAIPKTKTGELWAPPQTQLIGIQSGVDRERKLLGLVSIERVLDLLSND